LPPLSGVGPWMPSVGAPACPAPLLQVHLVQAKPTTFASPESQHAPITQQTPEAALAFRRSYLGQAGVHTDAQLTKTDAARPQDSDRVEDSLAPGTQGMSTRGRRSKRVTQVDPDQILESAQLPADSGWWSNICSFDLSGRGDLARRRSGLLLTHREMVNAPGERWTASLAHIIPGS
jgi:hypothetical protein